VEGIAMNTMERERILDQVPVENCFTADFFGGYSWRMSLKGKKTSTVFLSFTAGINNLLNNRNVISGGYEQLRFDFETRDPDAFPPKYYYAPGTTYFINMTFRF
jgi:hypothetical protein